MYDVEERGAEVVTDLDPTTSDHGTTEATVYFGRVKSPNTFGRWEVGRFTAANWRWQGRFGPTRTQGGGRNAAAILRAVRLVRMRLRPYHTAGGAALLGVCEELAARLRGSDRN